MKFDANMFVLRSCVSLSGRKLFDFTHKKKNCKLDYNLRITHPQYSSFFIEVEWLQFEWLDVYT